MGLGRRSDGAVLANGRLLSEISIGRIAAAQQEIILRTEGEFL
jgi:hypothetical protein